MQLCRAEAPTVGEAFRKLSAEVGADAWIVRVRPTRRGVEVLAAAERAPSDPGPPAPRGRRRHPPRTVPPAWEPVNGRARRVAFVGPTGGGKTTTLAKVAATAVLAQDQRVGLVTLDTYRLGAVPQLASFAEILGVPLRVADRPHEAAEAVRAFNDRDLIFIDTAGRNPQDPGFLHLAATLAAVEADEIHLVVPATMRPADARQAAARFVEFGATHLAVTKLDETAAAQEAFGLAGTLDLPLVWLGTGQDVPEALARAEGHPLAAGVRGRRPR
jgi:flagellar biosynthesis GTPase FlhF